MNEDQTLQPPRMTILSDHPILRADEEKDVREPDSFAMHTRLGAIYDIIRHKNTRAPIAVAVYGDWGTGKSSAMRWLGERLAEWSALSKAKRKHHFKVRSVWFDPWKFTKREDVWRGLIAEVIISAIKVRGASLKTVVSAARKFGLFLGRSFLNLLTSTELTLGVKEAGASAKVDLDALAKIAEDYRQTAHPEKAFLNDFERELREWVKESLAADERMVIFIDDLDRCLPEVVLEVLEALKLYLNIPQLIFVVGLDREVVETVVRQHYKEHGLGEAKAARYLDKMFQVEVDIPPSERLMAGYLRAQIEALDRVADGYWGKCLTGWQAGYREIIEDRIAELAQSNPREIKRLLNSTLVGGTAAGRNDALGHSEEQRFTQGCQVYLIQRVLRKFVPDSTALLRDNDALEFFERWSRFIQMHPGFRLSGESVSGEPGQDMPTEELRRGQLRKSPQEIDSPTGSEALKAYEDLRAGLPRYRDTGEAYPLTEQPQLWALLRIPFSVDVAAAAAVASDPAAAETAGGEPAAAAEAEAARPSAAAGVPLEDMPRSLRSAIARDLDKPVEKLRPDDLPTVTGLILMGTQIEDLAPLRGLSGLQTLLLSATQVSDVSPLSGLSGLQTLLLSDTQVSDVSPLSGLSRLRTLDLGGTQVSDVSPLSGLSGLQELWVDKGVDTGPLEGIKGLTISRI